MFRGILFFCTTSLIAAVFGYSGVSVAFAGIAQTLFYVFATILAVVVVGGLAAGLAPGDVPVRRARRRHTKRIRRFLTR